MHGLRSTCCLLNRWPDVTRQKLAKIQTISNRWVYWVYSGPLNATKARETFHSVFARPHIRGAILHYLRDKAAIIRLPRAVQDNNRDIGAGFNAATQHRRLVPLEEDMISQASDHSNVLDQLEKRRQLARAMHRLSINEQGALVEVILEGRSLRDVAQQTGVSAMTIQRRVKRGLTQLREQLSVQLELA